jgi:DcuC family C4-dicarboxylate transporter
MGLSLTIPTKTIGLVTAILLSVFLVMVVEYIRSFDARKVFDSIQTVFDGMGFAFATVVTLIVAGEIFATGLLATGSVNTLLGFAGDAGVGVASITIFLQGLITMASVLMGSGDAAIFSFMSVGAMIAEHFDVEAISVIMPMQISSSLARSMSPITAVVVAVSAIAGLNPLDVVKRTVIPMVGGIITLAIVNAILFL